MALRRCNGMCRPGNPSRTTTPVAYADLVSVSKISGASCVGQCAARSVKKVLDGRVTLALTSGIDSRSTLAAAMASGVEVRAVTMAHPLISKADRLIPPIVCESVNVRHDYLLPGTFDRERNALYTAHTFGNTADADRFFFAHRTFDGLQDAAWLVRSGPWAIAKAFWYAWFGDLTWEELRRRPDWVTRKHRTFSDRQRSTESLRQWIAWRDAHPEPWDWRDLWIRDQRMSGITAAIEQSLDLIDCASICAVNYARLFDIMLAEPEAARRAKTLQMRVLELSGTGLASIPVNPVLDSALVRHGRKGKRYVANVADERGAS